MVDVKIKKFQRFLGIFRTRYSSNRLIWLLNLMVDVYNIWILLSYAGSTASCYQARPARSTYHRDSHPFSQDSEQATRSTVTTGGRLN